MSFCCPIHGYYSPVPGVTAALCPSCSMVGATNGSRGVTTIQPAIVLQPSEENIERAVKHVQDAAAREPLTVDRASAAGRIREVVREAINLAMGRVDAAA